MRVGAADGVRPRRPMFKCCAARPSPGRGDAKRPAAEKLTLKVVVVGDGAVGKTCLLVTFRDDRFPEDYVPTTFDNYTAHMRCEIGKTSRYVTYDLWDTAGQESYDEMRKMSYTDTDVFLVVFSLDSRTSFENVRNAWHPELSGYEPAGVSSRRAKVVLVGTKSDMPNPAVTDDEAMALARQLGMYTYLSCSAKTRANISGVFDMVVKAHLGLRPDENIATARRSTLAAPEAAAPVPPPALAPRPAPAPPPVWYQPAPAPQPTWPAYGHPAAQSYRAPVEAPPATQYGSVGGPGGGLLLPGLPPNWQRLVDPSSGRAYYQDHSTKTTSWTPPHGCALIACAPTAACLGARCTLTSVPSVVCAATPVERGDRQSERELRTSRSLALWPCRS